MPSLVGESKFKPFCSGGWVWETKEVPTCAISREPRWTDEALPFYLIALTLKTS
jgi:hypothetical protein